MRLPSSLAALCAGFLATASASANHVTLDSVVRIAETNETVQVDATLANTGTALADNVRVVLEPPFGPTTTNALGHLDPGTTLPWRAAFVHPRDALPGCYAAVARIAYTDANGYAFDTFVTLPYTIGDAPADRAAVVALEAPTRTVADSKNPDNPPRLVATPLEHTATIRLTVTPLRDLPTPATLRLVLPESLAVVPPSPAFAALPTATVILTFTVTNHTALAGSRLPIAVLLESTEGGVHRTAIAELVLDIGGARPQRLRPSRPVPPRVAATALGLWLILEVLLRRRPRAAVPGAWLDVAVLAAATGLLASQLAIPFLLRDTLAVGGDTPAHHYLASHLREQLLDGGRIVSWAPGWWCGFPMFQYYFPLPYLVMALLSVAMPVNVAFKLGSVLGILALPFGAYVGGRLLRLPRPLPALLALATLPLLLDTTHTMWGVNIYSTLAGMIANSYSFALLPVALASAARDALDARPRPRTVVLLALIVLSHFFTAMLTALLLGTLFLGLALRAAQTHHATHVRRAFTLIPLGVLTFLVMAWWILPLVATRPWSVDFGEPWDIHFFRNLPRLVRWTLVPAVAASVALLLGGQRLRLPPGWRTAVGLHLLVFALSLGLFLWGARLSSVFVNCRLWPFMVHAALALAALMAGAAVWRSRVPIFATVALGLCVFAFPWDDPNHAPRWAEFNFRGLEALPEAPVVEALAGRLRDTPGRVAYDLHPGNEAIGSSRIFEVLPYLCGKPILEGGILNSALGSLAAYSVQGEISDNPAGWPTLVKPRRFDPATGLRRIELMGAKHFIARSRTVQAALQADPSWELIGDLGKWQLFENPEADGALVRAWNVALPVVRTTEPQREIVTWLGEPSALATPRLLLRPDEPEPPAQTAPSLPVAAGPPPPGFLRAVSTSVPLIRSSSQRIHFRTDAIGKPHLIAVSYFPNWQVRGARHVYLAAPGFMVVFPEEQDVELFFGRTAADRVGLGLTIVGLLYLLVWVVDARRDA